MSNSKRIRIASGRVFSRSYYAFGHSSQTTEALCSCREVNQCVMLTCFLQLPVRGYITKISHVTSYPLNPCSRLIDEGYEGFAAKSDIFQYYRPTIEALHVAFSHENNFENHFMN